MILPTHSRALVVKQFWIAHSGLMCKKLQIGRLIRFV
jgi:hypothetical protein